MSTNTDDVTIAPQCDSLDNVESHLLVLSESFDTVGNSHMGETLRNLAHTLANAVYDIRDASKIPQPDMSYETKMSCKPI